MPIIRILLTFAAVLLAIAAGLAFFSASGWPVELLSHFRMHYMMLSLITAGFLVLCGGRRAALFAVGAAALNLPALAPHLGLRTPVPAKPVTAESVPERKLSFATVNLLAEPGALRAFREYVDRAKPDIFLMTEVPWDQWTDYDTSFPDYPWRLPTGLKADAREAQAVKFRPGRAPEDIRRYGPDGRGEPLRLPPHRSDLHRFRRSLRHVALFSKVPVRDALVLWAEPPASPVLVARLSPAPCARPVTVVGFHAFAPITRRDMDHRDRTIRLAVAAARRAGGPSVMLGDLNATPWSPIIREVTEAGLLHDTARGRLVAATWSRRIIPPYLARLPFVGLPIDHVFVTPDISADRRRTGPFIGSDHRPVYVELSIPLKIEQSGETGERSGGECVAPLRESRASSPDHAARPGRIDEGAARRRAAGN